MVDVLSLLACYTSDLSEFNDVLWLYTFRKCLDRYFANREDIGDLSHVCTFSKSTQVCEGSEYEPLRILRLHAVSNLGGNDFKTTGFIKNPYTLLYGSIASVILPFGGVHMHAILLSLLRLSDFQFIISSIMGTFLRCWDWMYTRLCWLLLFDCKVFVDFTHFLSALLFLECYTHVVFVIDD